MYLVATDIIVLVLPPIKLHRQHSDEGDVDLGRSMQQRMPRKMCMAE
jgi:hypothetical protein